MIIDDPESIIFSEGQPARNHPEKKASRYYIPIKLVTKVSTYE